MISSDIINPSKRPILLYDGKCNLCDGLIRFLIKRDRQKSIDLLTLHEKEGRQIRSDIGFSEKIPDSIIFIDQQGIFIKSQAIFRIIEYLGGSWKILLFFKLFPDRVNNFIYDTVARNRYRIFGQRYECSFNQSGKYWYDAGINWPGYPIFSSDLSYSG